MTLCKCNGKEFKAYSFEEITADPKCIPAEKVCLLSITTLRIEKFNGFYILLRLGEYAIVWEDGDVLTASAAAVEQYRIK